MHRGVTCNQSGLTPLPPCPETAFFKGPSEWWRQRGKMHSSKGERVGMSENMLPSLASLFHEVAKKDPPLLFTSSNGEPASLPPNFSQPEPQQPDALGGHPDPASPKHNHSNPGWGCLEVNIHGTLIRNIWPRKRVDTVQAGSRGFVGGTQSYRG